MLIWETEKGNEERKYKDDVDDDFDDGERR